MVLKSGARLARRIAVTALGIAVLGVGVALLVLPGPGFLVIALGFFILATEYDWARRRFDAARRKAADLADQAAANRLSTAFTILFALGMVAAGVAWGTASALPFSSWWTGATLVGSGLIVLITILVSLRQASRAKAEGRMTDAEKIELRHAIEHRHRASGDRSAEETTESAE
jgi:uncharacterized protein (TIGR02611 family)